MVQGVVIVVEVGRLSRSRSSRRISISKWRRSSGSCYCNRSSSGDSSSCSSDSSNSCCGRSIISSGGSSSISSSNCGGGSDSSSSSSSDGSFKDNSSCNDL